MRWLWLIDDTADHHAVVQATIGRLAPAWGFAGFASGAAAIDAYAGAAAAELPEVVLMDFYLGGERGDQITAELRAAQRAGHRPLIVGFSSVRDGSQRIVEAGGDLILAKRAGPDGLNHGLLAWLRGR